MVNNNGSWIFISHSSADMEKIRIIRNEFEKYGQNPLAFFLKCLNVDTEKNKKELFDLIQREIEARDWFVYCESESARQSVYVQMEREYVKKCKKVFIWRINLDNDIESIKKQVRDICCSIQVYIVSSHQDKNIYLPLIKDLKENDFSVWDDESLSPGSNWEKSIHATIENIAREGFTLFLCTKNTIASPAIINELKTAKKYGSIIITFAFDVDVPKEIKEIVSSKNIYHIPCVPKEEDYYLLTDLIKAALSKRIVGAIQVQADAYDAEAKLQEKLNYEHRYHRLDAVFVGNSGATDDFIEVYKFPCCNKTVIVGDGPVSRCRCDGCMKE